MGRIISDKIQTDEQEEVEANDRIIFRLMQEMRKGREVFGKVGQCPICMEERQLLNNFSIEPERKPQGFEDKLHIGTRSKECICVECYCRLKRDESICPFTRQTLGISINSYRHDDFFPEGTPVHSTRLKVHQAMIDSFVDSATQS